MYIKSVSISGFLKRTVVVGLAQWSAVHRETALALFPGAPARNDSVGGTPDLHSSDIEAQKDGRDVIGPVKK